MINETCPKEILNILRDLGLTAYLHGMRQKLEKARKLRPSLNCRETEAVLNLIGTVDKTS
jgi:hypothetical protein